MANVPKREKADASQYEDKAYLTYEETAAYLGIRRSSLYNILTEMGIESHKFKLDKKRYVAIEDVKRLKQIREQPWLAGPDKPSETAA